MRVKDLLNSASQNEAASPEERIQHAQTLFQNIFNILMECISEETGQIRTRANTAMGNLQDQLNECLYSSLPDLMTRGSEPQISRPNFLHCDLRQSLSSSGPFEPQIT
ncbi:hypothetical protein ANCCAN_30354 [Ancylostoma caninum]|uniref:Uncharacterized protein n=1 Tax=Ancylostoma caninum TaxID=29170 RepID=A0A368F194_ANCCA|nr:hypothetical protein ANCCAN_30354 [Ancylostoma caninum]